MRVSHIELVELFDHDIFCDDHLMFFCSSSLSSPHLSFATATPSTSSSQVGSFRAKLAVVLPIALANTLTPKTVADSWFKAGLSSVTGMDEVLKTLRPGAAVEEVSVPFSRCPQITCRILTEQETFSKILKWDQVKEAREKRAARSPHRKRRGSCRRSRNSSSSSSSVTPQTSTSTSPSSLFIDPPTSSTPSPSTSTTSSSLQQATELSPDLTVSSHGVSHAPSSSQHEPCLSVAPVCVPSPAEPTLPPSFLPSVLSSSAPSMGPPTAPSQKGPANNSEKRMCRVRKAIFRQDFDNDQCELRFLMDAPHIVHQKKILHDDMDESGNDNKEKISVST